MNNATSQAITNANGGGIILAPGVEPKLTLLNVSGRLVITEDASNPSNLSVMAIPIDFPRSSGYESKFDGFMTPSGTIMRPSISVANTPPSYAAAYFNYKSTNIYEFTAEIHLPPSKQIPADKVHVVINGKAYDASDAWEDDSCWCVYLYADQSEEMVPIYNTLDAFSLDVIFDDDPGLSLQRVEEYNGPTISESLPVNLPEGPKQYNLNNLVIIYE